MTEVVNSVATTPVNLSVDYGLHIILMKGKILFLL